MIKLIFIGIIVLALQGCATTTDDLEWFDQNVNASLFPDEPKGLPGKGPFVYRSTVFLYDDLDELRKFCVDSMKANPKDSGRRYGCEVKLNGGSYLVARMTEHAYSCMHTETHIKFPNYKHE